MRAPVSGPFLFIKMLLKTTIYIDGENLRKAVEKYRFPGVRSGDRGFHLRERLINWTEFFKGIITNLDIETELHHRLIGARWYLANQVRIVADSSYRRQECLAGCQEELSDITERELIELSRDWIERERTRVRKESEEIRAELEKKYNYLEFKYVGEFLLARYEKYKCGINQNRERYYAGRRLGERGVDLGMAVDMVTQAQLLDAVVIVSGDRDFIPAIDYLKSKMVNIYSFTLAKGVPPNIEYLSEWLKGAVDLSLSFDEVDFLTKYLDLEAIRSIVGPNMVNAINARLTELGGPGIPE